MPSSYCTALDQLTTNTEDQIHALHARVKSLKNSKDILEPVVANANALTAYNASLDENTARFNSMPSPTPKELERAAAATTKRQKKISEIDTSSA